MIRTIIFGLVALNFFQAFLTLIALSMLVSVQRREPQQREPIIEIVCKTLVEAGLVKNCALLKTEEGNKLEQPARHSPR